MADNQSTLPDDPVSRERITRQREENLQYESVEFPSEPEPWPGGRKAGVGIQRLKYNEIGPTVRDRLTMAHTNGRLAEAADWWIGTLAGAEVIDKHTFETLKKIRSKLSKNYFDDKPVLDEMIQTIGRLKPRKR
jgi:hypothetical protein